MDNYGQQQIEETSHSKQTTLYYFQIFLYWNYTPNRHWLYYVVTAAEVTSAQTPTFMEYTPTMHSSLETGGSSTQRDTQYSGKKQNIYIYIYI